MPTPYDAERRAFSRAALARLVLSDTSADLAAAAGQLAITRFDDQTGPGGRVSEAATLRDVADRVLLRAVLFERERGSSWEQIARYLGTDAADAAERFTPAVERWERAFEEPYRLDATGRKRVPQLPTAAYDPEDACRRLDLTVSLRAFFQDEHPVSGELRPSPPAPDYSLGGRIPRRNLGLFAYLLATYTHDHSDTDWDAATAHVHGTAEDDPGSWDTHLIEGSTASVRLHLANATHGDDLVEAVVTGATDTELRLRIDTLFDALGPDALGPDA
ncbi:MULTISPECIES: hypothetical protein [Kitasatospora]|uniref:Uncharacterized protein n=1 Tax=Kitasatospora setae (strain ATCC 33774 / DSM 43861 / JCM 3304 / KCC A-0304 / NBRC 14216 / KM-6054) TaxID=452652 RepID=E4NJT1_KITSK|nr:MULTISPECIES: hypothetical protein [Kitasatospora]BAJ33229.1 hypothetical protein KSE_74740 [Kitasatospora setae KM-6054]